MILNFREARELNDFTLDIKFDVDLKNISVSPGVKNIFVETKAGESRVWKGYEGVYR